MKIELKFLEGYDLAKTKVVVLDSFEDFFYFFKENHDKGCIYEVELLEDDTYKEIHKTLEGWPDWKKQAYNEQFATSVFADKLKLNEGDSNEKGMD